MSTKNKKPLLFTNAIRKDLCGDSYWVSTKKISIHLGDAMDYDESRAIELKKVINALIEEAYNVGYGAGASDLRKDMCNLLGVRRSNT